MWSDRRILFDQGPEHGCDDPNCAPGCDCDRYLEIWNLVFTQFNKMPDGSYEPLQHKNIDTGAGLERLASVLQGCKTNFETDLIFPIIEATAKRAGVTYNEDPNTDVSLKVIADHARAVTALISDGVLHPTKVAATYCVVFYAVLYVMAVYLVLKVSS